MRQREPERGDGGKGFGAFGVGKERMSGVRGLGGWEGMGGGDGGEGMDLMGGGDGGEGRGDSAVIGAGLTWRW